MSKNKPWTQEEQLTTRLREEIALFWQQGVFETFLGVKQTRINYAAFSAQQHNKTLVISPGRCEGYLKYQELIFDFYQLGFNVFVIDHRGQGLSQRLLPNPHKGYVDAFEHYVDDLQFFIETIVSANSTSTSSADPKPYLLAHSMGSAIAIRLLQRCPHLIRAAVLASPMVAIFTGKIPTWLAKFLVNIAGFISSFCGLKSGYFFGQGDYEPTAFHQNPLTHSPIRFQQFVKLYTQTPQLQLGGVTIHWLQEAIKTEKFIFEQIPKITTPVLILQAGADKIVDNNAQNKFCLALDQTNNHNGTYQQPVHIANANHELFFEQDKYRNKAIELTLHWFAEH